MTSSGLADEALQIAVVAETRHEASLLQSLVVQRGYQIHSTTVLNQVAQSEQPQHLIQLQQQDAMDAWLINLGHAGPPNESLELWLCELNKPIIFSDFYSHGATPGELQLWKNRMAGKLHHLAGSINLECHPQGAAPFVWVLGASTGGPEAVRAFMQALPGDLGVAFIYIQHIDAGYEGALLDMLNKHSHYPAHSAAHGAVLSANTAVVIAGDRRVEILDNGTLALHDDGWPGAYSPSIDQVFASVANSYGSRCGAIVFSGMADDGVAGARLIHQQRGQVWVQSPSSCTVSSMPHETLNTGTVSVIASPEGLAARLVEFMKNEAGELL